MKKKSFRVKNNNISNTDSTITEEPYRSSYQDRLATIKQTKLDQVDIHDVYKNLSSRKPDLEVSKIKDSSPEIRKRYMMDTVDKIFEEELIQEEVNRERLDKDITDWANKNTVPKNTQMILLQRLQEEKKRKEMDDLETKYDWKEHTQVEQICRLYGIEPGKQMDKIKHGQKLSDFCDVKDAYLKFKKKPNVDRVLYDYNSYRNQRNETKKRRLELAKSIEEIGGLQNNEKRFGRATMRNKSNLKEMVTETMPSIKQISPNLSSRGRQNTDVSYQKRSDSKGKHYRFNLKNNLIFKESLQKSNLSMTSLHQQNLAPEIGYIRDLNSRDHGVLLDRRNNSVGEIAKQSYRRKLDQIQQPYLNRQINNGNHRNNVNTKYMMEENQTKSRVKYIKDQQHEVCKNSKLILQPSSRVKQGQKLKEFIKNTDKYIIQQKESQKRIKSIDKEVVIERIKSDSIDKITNDLLMLKDKSPEYLSQYYHYGRMLEYGFSETELQSKQSYFDSRNDRQLWRMLEVDRKKMKRVKDIKKIRRISRISDQTND